MEGWRDSPSPGSGTATTSSSPSWRALPSWECTCGLPLPGWEKPHSWRKEGEPHPGLSLTLRHCSRAPAGNACVYCECLFSEPRYKILIQLFWCKAGVSLLSPTSDMGIHGRSINHGGSQFHLTKSSNALSPTKKTLKLVSDGWRCCISFGLNWWCSI